MSTWVTIPCHRPYLQELRQCVSAVRQNGVDDLHTLVIATCDQPITSTEALNSRVIRYHGDWNMSKWWNLGLDFAAAQERGENHEVLVLNADAVLAAGAVDRLRVTMREVGAAMATPDRSGTRNAPELMTELRPFPKILSAAGYAFMLAGENGLRCDTRFPGWYNDDDIEWQARQRGGVVIEPRAHVQHEGHNTGHEFGTESHALFVSKWGSEPWT